MNKGFTMIELLVVIAGIILFSGLVYVWGNKTDENTSSEGSVACCQHVFVVSSEYNWWFNQYRTISRCAKCGIVM